MASSQFNFRLFFDNEQVSDRVLVFQPEVLSGDKRKVSQQSSAVKQRKLNDARKSNDDKKSSGSEKQSSTGDDMQDDSSMEESDRTDGMQDDSPVENPNEDCSDKSDGSSDDTQDESSLDLSNRRLHVSTAVLASHSKYFKGLLLSGFRENQQKEVIINLPSSKIQRAIDTIEAFYCQEIREGLSVGELLEFVVMGDLFDLGLVCKEAIYRIQLLELPLEDCLLVLDLPGSITSAEFFKPLKNHVESKVIGIFRQFDCIRTEYCDVFSPKFLSLNVLALKIILDSEETQIQCENDVLLPLSAWVNHDKKRSWDELLPHIRFAQMTAAYLIYIERVQNFFHCEMMEDYVTNAHRFKDLKDHTELRDSLYHGTQFEKRSFYKKKVQMEVKLNEAAVRGVYSETSESYDSRDFVLMGFTFFIRVLRKSDGVFFYLKSGNDITLKLKHKATLSTTGHIFLDGEKAFKPHRGWGQAVPLEKLSFEHKQLSVNVLLDI